MIRLSPRMVPFALALGLAAGLVSGCQQKKPSPPPTGNGPALPGPASSRVLPGGFEKTAPAGPVGGPSAVAEDPEAAAYFKQKGWPLMKDMRLADGKWLTYLVVENRDKPFENLPITPDDYKMIARSKASQVLDLRKVKTTDEGLKVIAGMPRLEGIIVGGEDVTDAGVKELARCKSLDSVALVMTKKVTDDGVKELAALPNLQSLHLTGMTLSGAGFAPFAGSKTLRAVSLEYVDDFSDDGARNLAKLPNLDELKIGKGFGEQKLTSAGIKAIVDAHVPPKFDFPKELIDDGLLEALVKKGWLYGPSPPGSREKKPATPEEVKSISLDGSKVTDRGMRAVLNCTNVVYLFLQKTSITDETLKKLSAFKKLEYLALEGTKVTAAGLEALTGLPIKHVAMEGCELSEDSFKAFGKMQGLEELWLPRTKMKAEWVKHLAGLPKLKDLSLMDAACDDAAAKQLAAITSLETLALNNTGLGDAGFQALLKLPKLRSLFVDGTKVSKEVYQKAKKEHPKLTLYYYRYDQ